jgi:hypothetical protein
VGTDGDGEGRGKYLVPYAHVEVPSVMARDEKLADELDELSTKLCSSL